jgi:hypothetical protein
MLADGSAAVGIVVQGALPRDSAGRLLVPFRLGDVLRISGPFVETTVTDVDEFMVVLRWPWRRVDPASDYGWMGGEFAFPFRELHKTLYRTDPPMQELRPGQRCRVGIPPTLFHVASIWVLDEPLDRGWLPRPSGFLTVLPVGATFDPTDRESTIAVELVAAWGPDGPTRGVEVAEPIRMEVVYRPYAFLDDGDVVTDSSGRTWRFEVPFWWQELDGPATGRWLTPRWIGAPRWPLTLASGNTGPAPVRSGEVAAATAAGSHADEVARWQRLTSAEPVPIRPYVDMDDDPVDDFDDGSYDEDWASE